MSVRSLRVSIAAVAAVLLTACGETPSAPAKRPVAPTGSSSASILLSTPTTVIPLQRTSPLAANISVSKTIGILGGAIAIPQAGISIVVPPLALSSTKTITVTAVAGSKLAYEFEPHGIRFNVPLVMTQDLHNTQVQTGLANPLSLFVGYYPNSSNVTSVTELLGVGVSLQNLLAVTTLWHFSGYIVAVGRDDSDF